MYALDQMDAEVSSADCQTAFHRTEPVEKRFLIPKLVPILPRLGYRRISSWQKSDRDEDLIALATVVGLLVRYYRIKKLRAIGFVDIQENSPVGNGDRIIPMCWHLQGAIIS